MSLFRRAWIILREEGWLVLWFRILGETVYRRVLLLALDLPPRVPLPVDISARWLKTDEAESYAAFDPALTAEQVQHRLGSGDRCLVVETGGRFVQGRWIAAKRAWIEYLSMPLSLPDGTAYVYQSYTPPDLRGKGFATAAAVVGGWILHREGFKQVMACIQPDRAIAYPPSLKAGYRPVGYLGWFRLGPWRFRFRRSARRFPRYGPRPWAEQPSYWDKVTPPGGSWYLDHFLGRLKRRAHLGLIRRWGGVPEHGRVLKTDLFEEANGPDRLVDAFRRPENSIFGMDISPHTAAVAKRMYSGCSYAAADARRLPFADGCFDLIVSPSTLDHFPNPADLDRSLRELRRTLRPGGRLILTLDNRSNLTYPLLRLAGALGMVPYFLGHSYVVVEVRRALEVAGFRVLDTTWILHAPRLLPVAAMAIVRVLHSPRLQRHVRRSLLRCEAWGQSRPRAWTGAFVAALAKADT